MSETQMQKAGGNGSTAIATVKDKNDLIKRELDLRADKIAALCAGTGVGAKRLIESAMLACVRNPDLLECTPASIVMGVYEAAALGLMLDGVMGQAYLTPRSVKNRRTNKYEKRAVFVPGYKGLIALARNSGMVTSIEAHVVYSGDAFTYAWGLSPVLSHIPAAVRAKEAVRTHVWALARFKDRGHHFEVMSTQDIEALIKRSQIKVKNDDGSPAYSPWNTDTDEMWKKTVLRRLCKFLPLTTAALAAADRLIMSEYDEPAPILDEAADADVDPITGLIAGPVDAPTGGLDNLARS